MPSHSSGTHNIFRCFCCVVSSSSAQHFHCQMQFHDIFNLYQIGIVEKQPRKPRNRVGGHATGPQLMCIPFLVFFFVAVTNCNTAAFVHTRTLPPSRPSNIPHSTFCCNIPDQSSCQSYRREEKTPNKSLQSHAFRVRTPSLTPSHPELPRGPRGAGDRRQILTGDTHSIKGTLQHPDVLWRASHCLPGRSDAPPHTPPPDTKGGFCYLFHARVQ